MTSTTDGSPSHAPDARVLRRETQLCISLSGRPSNIGTKFHNYLYNEIGLDYVYKAFTTSDLEGAVRGIRALGFIPLVADGVVVGKAGSAGVGTGPPKVPAAPNPTSSSRTTTTLGAPSGG